VLTAASGAGVPLRYPTYGTEDFFISGQADGASALSGRPVATGERYGSGRRVSFSIDPNFRGFTDGTEKVLRNAIFGADPATAGIASSPVAARRRAMRAT